MGKGGSQKRSITLNSPARWADITATLLMLPRRQLAPSPAASPIAERRRLSSGPPLCLPPDGCHLCHWPPLVCLSHCHLPGTHGESEEGEHDFSSWRAPRVPGHQVPKKPGPAAVEPGAGMCPCWLVNLALEMLVSRRGYHQSSWTSTLK